MSGIETEKKEKWIKAIFFLLLFLSVIVCGTLLKVMQSFFKPVLFAILLAFVFFPIVRGMNKKWKIPWWLGITIVYAAFFGLFVGIANILTASFRAIIATLPDYEEKLKAVSSSISSSITSGKAARIMPFFKFDDGLSFSQNILNSIDVKGFLKTAAVGAGGTVFSFAKSLFLVSLLSVFFLAEMNSTEQKVVEAFGNKYSDRVHTVMQNVITETMRYISIKFIVSIATGIVVGLSCQVVGMDFSVVFGFLAFCMNFIPTFGSIIAWLLTTLFALLQFYPSPAPILFVFFAIAATNIIIGQILEPKIEGKDLGLSTFVILASLSLWGWIWGFLGMLIAVPITVIIKIICENVSFLQPVAIFLGHKPSRKNNGKIEELLPAEIESEIKEVEDLQEETEELEDLPSAADSEK